MPRVITYSIATQYNSGPNRGYYNPTYRWDRVDNYFNLWSEYFDLVFRRVNSGAQVSIIQYARNFSNPNAWMQTSGRVIHISPTINYGRDDYLCGKPTNHEMCHWNRISHLGGSVALMTPNAGTCHNITKQDTDGGYMPYPWKSTRRPWLEPELMKQRYSLAASVTNNIHRKEPNGVISQVWHDGYYARHEDQHYEIRASAGLFPESKQEPYNCYNKSTFWGNLLFPAKPVVPMSEAEYIAKHVTEK